VKRKARSLLYSTKNKVSIELRLVSAYAYAVSEVNASGGLVVTAPTCGASGVLPSVLYYLKDVYKYSDEKIIDALATAGIIGNIIKTNGSISGAEAGCQAEIGSACAMAAAAYSELEYGNMDDIEYAAEIALEHHLGLTCDPINGYVQIPCIERNAVAAHRAINAGELAQLLTTTSLISFDTIVETMKETGKDLSERYRETSLGGLAKKYRPK
jgi:L-serine dehydratase